MHSKNYGHGLETLYIGIICVSSEFDFFFKERKPSYKKGKNTKIEDGRSYEQINFLTYDIKLNYEDFLKAEEKEVKKMLAEEIIRSLNVFDKVKIKAFNTAE